MARISHQSDNAVAVELLAQQRIGEVQVTVKLRSTSKALRNDPKPADHWEKLLASTLSGSDTDDGLSTFSAEDSRAPGCPTHPPTPVQPISSTAQDRPEPSVSEDDSHPHGDRPVTGDAEESNCDHLM